MKTKPSHLEALESRIAPAAAFALTSDNQLLSFDTATPAMATVIDLSGFTNEAAETVEGIDFRPATGALYLLTREVQLLGEPIGRLYTVNTTTGALSAAIQLAADPADTSDAYTGLGGTDFAVDFNPNVDRLRVVGSDGANLRINVATGAVTTDTAINGTDTPLVTGAAYTNSFAAGGATQLFDIDVTSGQLFLQNPPNAGTLVAVGELGVDPTAVGGFDIAGTKNLAFASLTVGGSTGLYSINLKTGAAKLVNTIGNGTATVLGLAVAPEPIAGKTATFRDVDGDIITITTSKGSFAAENFTTTPAGAAGGVQLQSINFLGNTDFDGANITISAKRGPLGGDGFVNLGFLDAAGIDLGKVTVDGDLGRISVGDIAPADNSLTSLTVKSLGLLGTSTQAGGGTLESVVVGNAGSLIVKSDVRGATFTVNGDLKTVSVAGSVIAGTGLGRIETTGDLKTVNIGGNLAGGALADSGKIEAAGALGTVNIKGSVIGGTAEEAGTIDGGGSIGSVTIGRDLIGGGGPYSGSIYTGGGGSDTGAIGNVTIKGDLIATSNAQTGIISDSTLGAVKIGGDVRGTAAFTAKIQAEGLLNPTTAKQALAIKSVTVTGSAEFAEIRAGYGIGGTATNADVQIGAVKVGRDWIASNLVAGVEANGDGFGNTNDSLFDNGEEADIISRIASISIGGSAIGTPGGTDAFGFVATQIGSFSVGGTKFPLTAAVDGTPQLVGSTGDLRLREVAPAAPVLG